MKNLVDDGSDQDHDSHIMVWHVDDNKRITKEASHAFHQPLDRKLSKTGGYGVSETDGGGAVSTRREVILKGMIKDIKDVTKVVHDTASTTMSFFEHNGLTFSPTSMSSSSIDVGPSPGSGLQTEADSTEMESNQSDDDFDDEEEDCETLKGIIESAPIVEEPGYIEKPNFRLDYDREPQQPLSVIETGKDVVDEMSNEISIPTPKPSSTGYALATNSSSSTVGSEGPPSIMEPREDFTQHFS